MPTKVIIYTHPDCNYSTAAKDEMDQAEVEYEEIDLNKNPEAWEDLMRLTGGERITPVIVEGEMVIVGYHGVG